MHASGIGADSLSWRSGSYISTGPVAQLSPRTSTPRGASAVIAAPISVPGSIRPVSSIVTCTWIGTTRPAATIARWHAAMAALPDRRSNIVSTRSRSTPPSSRPRAISS